MRKVILGILTYIFLVILAPVFLLTMAAPDAMQTILTYWSALVAMLTLMVGALWLWIRLDTR